jgi:DNA-binding MarR family transcriptional regulator
MYLTTVVTVKDSARMTVAEQIGALRRTLNRLLSQRVGQKTSRPVAQLLALRSVARGEVTTQAQLAERLLIDAPAASRMVARLAEEGLIEQCEGKDRRCVMLKVTAKAAKEIATVDDGMDFVNAEIRGLLSAADHAKLKTMLTTLLGGVRERPAAEKRARRR